MGRLIRVPITDFIANALIEAERRYKKNYVTKKELENFEIAASKYLEKTPENITLCESWGDSSVEGELQDYFLVICKSDEGVLYFKKEGITTSMLWGFRSRISCNVQLAFESEECGKCLNDSSLAKSLESDVSELNFDDINIVNVNCAMGDSDDWVNVPGLTQEDKEELNKLKNTTENIQKYLNSLNNGYIYKVQLLGQNIYEYTEKFIVVSVREKGMTRALNR